MVEVEFSLGEQEEALLELRQKRRFLLRCEESKLHSLVDDAFNEIALKAVARKYNLCDVCDFSGLNISAAHVLMNCVVSVLYRFPYLRSKMCFLGSRRAYITLLRAIAADDEQALRALGVQHICDREFAESFGQGMLRVVDETRESKGTNTLAFAVSACGIADGIVVDEADFSTERFLAVRKELAEGVRCGNSPQKCDTVASVIYHEIGHLLDYLCDVQGDPALSARFCASDRSKIEGELSRYAATSSGEYIAEGFSEFMSNPNPREAARFVAASIEKSYSARFA